VHAGNITANFRRRVRTVGRVCGKSVVRNVRRCSSRRRHAYGIRKVKWLWEPSRKPSGGHQQPISSLGNNRPRVNSGLLGYSAAHTKTTGWPFIAGRRAFFKQVPGDISVILWKVLVWTLMPASRWACSWCPQRIQENRIGTDGFWDLYADRRCAGYWSRLALCPGKQQAARRHLYCVNSISLIASRRRWFIAPSRMPTYRNQDWFCRFHILKGWNVRRLPVGKPYACTSEAKQIGFWWRRSNGNVTLNWPVPAMVGYQPNGGRS